MSVSTCMELLTILWVVALAALAVDQASMKLLFGVQIFNDAVSA